MAQALVLAGGRGSRLGGAKATAPLAGRPLIGHVLHALAAGGIEAIVVAKADTALPPLECPLLVEPALPRHPLCGIVTGLRALEPGAAVVCPADMPFLTGELLAWLASLHGALVVVAGAGAVQPLVGRYESTLLPALAEMLAAERPMREVALALATRVVSEEELRRFGDPARLLRNVNTPAELADAGRALGGG
jgi:molybdopterin-guanine dinucleotide biosynthesis protein A